MFLIACVAVLVGCVATQTAQRDLPIPTKSPTLPNFPWNKEGCNIQNLQSCVAPLMEFALIHRPEMELSSTMPAPDLDTVCRLMKELKRCVLPVMKNCGTEATSAMSAAFDAINYLCVDARNETENYMRCLQQNNNAAEFGVCFASLIQDEMEMLAHITDPQFVQKRICSLIENYEVCAEKKAGSVCNGEALVTNFFNILNKGLYFLQCPNLGGKPEATLPPSQNYSTTPEEPSLQEFPILEGTWDGQRPGMEPVDPSIRCMNMSLSACIVTRMQEMRQFDQQFGVCEYSSVKMCMDEAGKGCGTNAERVMEATVEFMHYLCFEKKYELKDVSSCVVRGLVPAISTSMSALNWMSVENFVKPEDFAKPENLARVDIMCGCMRSYGYNMERAMGKCGYQAEIFLDNSVFFTFIQRQTGVWCGPDQGLVDGGLPTAEPAVGLSRHHHRHHHRALKIALPIAGVVVVAIIVAIVLAVRRSRGGNRRQQLEKADLVENDLLQQNLRFAITQTPKEKSQDGLKV